MIDFVNYFRARQTETLAAIRALVEQESPTLDAQATTALTTRLAEQFESLAASTRLHRRETGAHLVARVASGSSANDKPVMLLGHVDTVWPRGALERMPFRVEDGRAYGPGVFDMKANLVVMLEALAAIKELKLTLSRPVKILLSCDEESGSPTSRDLIEAEAAECAAALVFEPSLPGGAAKTARKGIADYQLTARGIAAHAGVDPDKGASAIAELAHQIVALHQLNDLPNGVSVNVGVTNGGTYSNVIAAEARARIDVRFRTMAQGEAVMSRIRALRPALADTSIELSGGLNRPPLERSPGVVALYEQARRLAAELDFELGEGSTGGGSDGNFTAALGIPTLDGLGVEGLGAHAAHEHIVIADLPRRAALLVRLLVTL